MGCYVAANVIANVVSVAVHYDVCTHLHCSLRCECLRTNVRGAWSIMVASVIGAVTVVGEDLHLNRWSQVGRCSHTVVQSRLVHTYLQMW